jgi:YfiH family protein
MNKYSPLGNLADGKLICAFSSRPFRNMSLFYGDTAESLDNRKNFLKPLGIDYRSLVCAKQIHANNIRHVKEKDKGRGALSYDTAIPDTDAFITDRKNLPLAIFTADCLSIFLYDPKTPAIGLVHAGWRSSKDHIAAGVLESMREKFSSRSKNIRVGFGPAIRSCCYEVGRDFRDYFSDGLIRKGSNYYLDLVGVNKKELLDCGVDEKNIFDPEICTSCSGADFFSFRRQGNACGRMMSVAMLK